MMDIQIGNPNAIYLLAFAALAVLLACWVTWATARDRRRFASSEVARRLLPKPPNRWFFASLHGIAIILLVLGLMDIRWGKSEREVQQEGYEIMFAVDVSRSMLAADASPNRLERAKQQIIAMLDEMDNDRIGLVAFAGSARQVVPLTRQYDEFISSLSELTPESVDLGGSQLGLALKTAAKGFLDKTGSNRTIVLFSDGEDQDSSPAKVARELRETEGLRVFTIGLGDEQRGARIPNHRARFRDFVRYQGEVVYSKLESAVLKQIASEADGVYIPAGTQRINMSDFYHRFIASAEKTSFESATFSAYTPRYLWFLLPAFCLLCLDVWQSTKPCSINKPAVASLAKLLLVGVSVFQFTSATVSAQETDSENLPTAAVSRVEEQINLANQLIAEGNPDQAVAILNSISTPAYRDQRNYNLGVAHFRRQEFENAAAQFQQTAKSKITEIAAKSRFNLGNCFYQQALDSIENSTATNASNIPQESFPQSSPIEQLQQAIAQYRSSLRLAPDNVDARRNLELAFRLLKKQQQEKEQEQQQEEEQSQEEQQQSSDDPSEDKDSEKQKDSEQNQDADSSEPQQNREPQDQPSEQPEQDADQPQQGNNEDNPTDEESKSNQNQPNQQPSEQQNQQQNQDQSSDQRDSTNDPQSTSEANRQTQEQDTSDAGKPIEGELTAKDQADAEANQDQSRQPRSGQPQSFDSSVMTREEAMKMLQAIRDRKLQRKFQLRERERRRQLLNRQLDGRRVEKDW